MEHFDDIVTDRRISKQVISDFLSRSKNPNDLLFNHYHIVHTSGSSGEVGYFVYSEKEWAIGASQNSRANFNNSDPQFKRPRGRMRMAFYGATGGHFTGVTMISSALKAPLKYFIDVKILEINSPLPEVIATLNQFQPHAMFGYTAALKILANKQNSGELKLNLLGISSGGESLSKSDWQILTDAFRCRVVNTYGCSEHLMMGFADAENNHIYLFDDDLIYEFYSDHSIITNLYNYTLPLIRYYMSDVLQPIEGDSSVEPYRVIRSLVGRNEIVPTFVNDNGDEDFISPHTINEIFVPGVNRFQFHIVSHKQFLFKVCLNDALNTTEKESTLAAVKACLNDILAQKKMSKVEFEVVAVDDLPVNPRTRKFQLIVDSSAN